MQVKPMKMPIQSLLLTFCALVVSDCWWRPPNPSSAELIRTWGIYDREGLAQYRAGGASASSLRVVIVLASVVAAALNAILTVSVRIVAGIATFVPTMGLK